MIRDRVLEVLAHKSDWNAANFDPATGGLYLSDDASVLRESVADAAL